MDVPAMKKGLLWIGTGILLVLVGGLAYAAVCARPEGGVVRYRAGICRESEREVVTQPLVWEDSQGEEVGLYHNGDLALRHNGRVYLVLIDRNTGIPVTGLTQFTFFDAPDCVGPPLLRANTEVLRRTFLSSTGTLFTAPDTEAPRTIQSYWDDVFIQCVNRSITAWVGEPVEVPFEFQSPFRLK